jgi:hypothetical protein
MDLLTVPHQSQRQVTIACGAAGPRVLDSDHFKQPVQLTAMTAPLIGVRSLLQIYANDFGKISASCCCI